MCDFTLLRMILSLILRLNGVQKGAETLRSELAENFIELSNWANTLVKEKGEYMPYTGEHAGVECLALMEEARKEAALNAPPERIQKLDEAMAALGRAFTPGQDIHTSRDEAVRCVEKIREAYPHMGVPLLVESPGH